MTEVGGGLVRPRADALALTLRANGHAYSNAQITDYPYPPGQFPWQPPLRLTVTARASAPGSRLVGTAGFGFWNHPFSPDIRRLPRLPRAIWFFFGSPPNNMALAKDVPGFGWKAATIDASGRGALALIPIALPLMLAMRLPTAYEALWGGVQRHLGISERLLDGDLLSERHTYTLEWWGDRAVFRVDDQIVHESPVAPRGRCGFVAWIDNQYAVATPQGRLRFGMIPVEREQSLSLEQVSIEPLNGSGRR
ncbi:MAG: hypothetical protein JNL42_03500 [Anaerolineae bacterium]|nr:hypothetical protein [Anaerolineae bacterium]